jgi:hypothetical protein
MRQAFVQSAVPRRASSLRLRHYLQEAEPEVKHVELGKTGLWVSRVGLGGIPVQRLTEAEAVTLIQHALDLGITFLDTANAYTTSEERMGQAIAGRRSQVVLATKTMARDRATATPLTCGNSTTSAPSRRWTRCSGPMAPWKRPARHCRRAKFGMWASPATPWTWRGGR